MRRLLGTAVVCAVALGLLAGGAQSRSSTTTTFTVDTTADTIDISNGDGLCADSTGHCSLRAAVQQAQALGGTTLIILPAGTYTLSLGQLQMSSTITVQGAGANQTTIAQGSSGHRVIEVTSGTTAITGTTITGGTETMSSPDPNAGVGGGVYVAGGATLDLSQDEVSGNTADSSGGGIDLNGTVEIDHSTIANNTVTGLHFGNGIGGGIDDFGTGLTITNSTIYGNTASNQGGALLSANATTLTNDTIDGNSAPHGGAVYVYGGTIISTENTVLAGDTAPECFNGTLTSLGGNVADDASCGLTDATDQPSVTSAIFGPFQNNGGPTDTLLPLVSGAAAGAAVAADCPSDDQRGDARPAGGPCDSGAVQVSSAVHVFTVDTTADTHDATPGDGTCADAGSDCSLRAAVEEANALGGASEISVPANTYMLSLGQLLFTADISLTGAGARTTSIIQGNVQRVIEISTGSSVISGVTIQGGDTLTTSGEPNEGVGGGIWIDHAGSLTLTHSTVTYNVADASGGGIDNDGTLAIDHSTIAHNGAGTIGGGIDDFGTLVSIGDSTIGDNSAATAGGGLYSASTTTLTNDTFAGNQITAIGGGPGGDVYVDSPADVIALNTIFSSSSTGDDCNAALDSHGYNLGTDGSCGLTATGDQQLVADAQLGPLADNGGQTDTFLPAASSPAVDAVLGGICPADDQRGTARPQGAHCDVGAVEVAGTAAPAVSASQSTVSASPLSVTADGVTTSTVTVTLKTSGGGAVSGKAVTLTAGSGSSTIATVSGTTNGSGVATFTVKDATAESVTYTAHDTSDAVTVTQTAAVTFTAPVTVADAAQSTVSASPTSVTADGSTTSTITVTLKTSGGGAVSGKAVTLTAGGGSSTIATVSGTTNGSGVATFTVKDATAESVTYTAHDTSDAVTVTQTATVTFTAPSTGGGGGGGGGPSAPQPPTVTIALTPASPTTAQFVSFTGSASDPNGVAIVSYSWSFGDGHTGSGATQSHRYSAAGTYAVTLSATDADGVTGTTTRSVVVTAATLAAAIDWAPGVGVAGQSEMLAVHLTPSGSQVQSASWNFGDGGSGSGATVHHAFAAAGTYTVTVTATATTGATVTATAQVPVAPTALGPVSASKSELEAPAAASTAGSITVTVTLRDAYGRSVSGKVVQLTASGHANVTRDSTRGATTTFTVTDATPQTVTFVASDSTDGVTLTHTATTTFAAPASIHRSTITVSPAQVAADGATASTVKVTLKDSSGHATPGKTVTLLLGLQGGGTVAHVRETSPQEVVTNTSGVASFTLVDATPEQVVVSGEDKTDGFSLNTKPDVRFIPLPGGPASATTSTLFAGAPAAADGTSSTTVTATLLNSAGGPVPNAVVTLHAASGSSHIASATVTTDSKGQAVFTVTDPKAESVLYSATDTTDGVAISQTAQVTFFRPGLNGSTSTVTAAPSALPDDGTTATTVTVTLRDAGGTPVPNEHVHLRASGSATVTPATATTGSNGVATFTSTDTASETVTYTASVDGSTVGLPTATAVFGTLHATVALKRDPGTTRDDWEVTLRLLQGPTSVKGQTLQLIPPSGSNVNVTPVVISPGTAAGVTALDGRAGFVVRSSSDGTVVLGIRDESSGLTLADTVSLTFSSGPSHAHSSVDIDPTSVIADGHSAATVTLTLADTLGTPVVDEPVELEVATPGSKATSARVSGPSLTDTTGTAVFQIRDATAERVSVVAVARPKPTTPISLASPQTVTFVTASQASVSPTQSTIAADALVPADGTTTGTVTVTLRNGGGGTVAGKVVTLHGGGTSTIAPATAITDSSGVARFHVADTSAETVEYTATDTTDQVALSGTAHTQFYDPGAVSASTSTVVATPIAAAGDGASPTTVTVTLHNVGGAPVAGTQVALTSNGTNVDIEPAVALTDATGVATFTATDAASELVTFTAVETLVPSLELPQATVTFGAPPPPTVSIRVSPTIGLEAGQNAQLFATTSDPSGVAITSYAWDFGDGVTGAGQNVAHAYAQPGTYAVTLHVTDARGASAVASTTVVVTGWVMKVTAQQYAGLGTDGGAAIYVTAPAPHSRDQVQIASISGGSAQVLVAQGVTRSLPAVGYAGGESLAAFTIVDSVAETVVLQIEDPVLHTIADVAVTFVPTAVGDASTIEVSPRSVPADDSSPATVTVRLADANGNPAPNNAVGLHLVGTGANTGLAGHVTVTPAIATTNAQGVATFTVTDATPESFIVNAIDETNGVSISPTGGARLAAMLQFTQALAPSASHSVVHAAATSVSTFAPGTTVSVKLVNKAGGLVPDKTVALEPKSGHAAITPAHAVTDARGMATFTIVDTTAESVTFVARDESDAIVLTQQPTVKFADHTVDTDASTVSGPGSTPAGGDNPLAITVRVLDGIGKPVAGRTVHLHPSSANSTVSPASVTSDQNGYAVFQVYDPKVETVTYTANVEAGAGSLVTLTSKATVSYTTPVPSAIKSTIDPVSQQVDFALPATITVTLRNGAGATLAGRQVRLTFVYQDAGIGAPGHPATPANLPDLLVTVDPNRGQVIDAAGFYVNTGTSTTDANGVAVFTVSANHETDASFPRVFTLDVEEVDADGTTHAIGTASVDLNVTYPP